MPGAFVKAAKGSQNGTSATTNPFGSAVAAGNLICVTLTSDGPANQIGSVTDSLGNTYSKILSRAPGGDVFALDMWYAENIIGGTPTVTATISQGAARNIGIVAAEYSGLATSSALDQFVSATSTSTTADSGNTATTTQADELVIGALGFGSTASITAGSGYTNLVTESALADARASQESKTVNATGQYNATFTPGFTITWVCAAATFKAAAAGGGGGDVTGTLTATLPAPQAALTGSVGDDETPVGPPPGAFFAFFA